MSDLNLIVPEVFAAEKQVLEGAVKLGSLDERVSSNEYLADRGADVFFTLKGGQDRLGRPFLDLGLKADLLLVCQRCLKPMPFALREMSRIVLFSNEESLDKAMLADDELEGMLSEPELDVGVLVEDQILMALPFSPRHEHCDNAQLDAASRDKSNPFAALAGLKGSS
ncbi:MAG: YceD family protein [Neisseria sp.]|uniref:YceD family protein n=1 Tax=Neisseria sp. TaxID=192066 RepID=UPI0026DC050B|nr:YceD family protein [Neisseria sp.]MDO4248805.1 YceD family protein [Neisseria sp.]